MDSTRVATTRGPIAHSTPARQSGYRSADRGYTSRYGSKDSYKAAYRGGFRAGYDDGYREARAYGSDRRGASSSADYSVRLNAGGRHRQRSRNPLFSAEPSLDLSSSTRW
jgi:hypothetical protein